MEGAGDNQPFRTFTAKCSVYFDELDAFGMLHNGRYIALVERGMAACLTKMGLPVGHEDTMLVVREMHLKYGVPIQTVGEVELSFWIDRISRSSLTFGFVVTSADGQHVRGTRSVTKIDPTTNRSTPWSDEGRALFGVETNQDGVRVNSEDVS